MGIILPERFNSFIQLPSRDKLSIGDVVTGRLLECKDGYCLVDLNDCGLGKIDLNDFSYFATPTDIKYFLGTKITAEVIAISSDFVILSRKSNILKTYNLLEEGSTILGVATTVFQKVAFFDIGNGVKGKLKQEDYSSCFIENLDNWIFPGTKLRCKITKKFSIIQGVPFRISHKLTFPLLANSKSQYQIGSIIPVRIGMKLNPYGYQCQVTPRIRGIVNVPKDTNLIEGSASFAEVVSINLQKGLILNSVKNNY